MIFDRRYLFQGHAVGAAARFTRFENEPIEVDTCFEGSAALPLTGGCLRSESGPREITHPKAGFLLSFQSATAKITGGPADPRSAFLQTMGQMLHHRVPARVEAEASVTGLKVRNHLTVERLHVHVIGEDQRNHGETRFFSPETPEISGVIINGAPLHVEVDVTLLNVPTKQALHEEYRSDSRFRESVRDCIGRGPDGDDKVIPEFNGYIAATVVRKLSFPDGAPRGVEIAGNKLIVQDFARIYFGELVIGADSRRLTLLRLDLGSPVGGDASFGETRPNGVQM